MQLMLVLSMSRIVLSIILAACQLSTASPVGNGCGNSATHAFGNVFLTNGGGSLARGPLIMVLPDDSAYSLDGHRHRRHVVCGKTEKKSDIKTFEQRAVCPFHHIINKNEKRIPAVLEEIECDCDRPSHLSPYTEIRCQSVKYRLPVLIQDEDGHYQSSHEELTLACIPVAPKSSEFEMHNLN